MKKNIKHFPADTGLNKDEEGKIIHTFLNDSKIDAELYAYYLSMSYGTEDGLTVVYKENLPSQEQIGTIINKSRRTIVSHLKYLKDTGYIIDDVSNKRFILPKMEKMYFKVPQDTIQYLQNTVKQPVIKTYIYLGQRFNYKQSQATKEQYVFTLKEICEHLGLNYERNYKTIKDYLICLEKFELIQYQTFRENKTPKMKLLSVKTDCPQHTEKI